MFLFFQILCITWYCFIIATNFFHFLNLISGDHFIGLSGFETLLKAIKFSAFDVKIEIMKIFSNFAAVVNVKMKTYLLSIDILKNIFGEIWFV